MFQHVKEKNRIIKVFCHWVFLVIWTADAIKCLWPVKKEQL